MTRLGSVMALFGHVVPYAHLRQQVGLEHSVLVFKVHAHREGPVLCLDEAAHLIDLGIASAVETFEIHLSRSSLLYLPQIAFRNIALQIHIVQCDEPKNRHSRGGHFSFFRGHLIHISRKGCTHLAQLEIAPEANGPGHRGFHRNSSPAGIRSPNRCSGPRAFSAFGRAPVRVPAGP